MTDVWSPLSSWPGVVVDAAAAAWALPTPVDGVAVVGLLLLAALTWCVTTPTVHVAQLGAWWPPVFWSAWWCLARLGDSGASSDAKLFLSGEDVSAYATRAGWLGWAASVTRFRVRLRAQVAAGSMIAGYGGAFVLWVVAVVWVWLIPAVAGVFYWRWRTRRVLERRWQTT